MFFDGDFSNLEIIEFHNKKIYIVDRHNFVLPIWWRLINNTPLLVSFDYHTDTIKPLSNYGFIESRKFVKHHSSNEHIKKANEIIKNEIKNIEINSKNSIIDISRKLNNDEHIRMAKKLDIIKDFYIVSIEENLKQCDGNFYRLDCLPTCNKMPHDDECFQKIKNNVLEDEYILNTGFSFNTLEQTFILDIDCDYFTCLESLQPNQFKVFKNLVINSEFITIAREPEYCFFDQNKIEKSLVSFIKSILDECK